MMYRIDLPVADGGLVQRCIAGIATAGDDKIDVDLTVFNPARIWRIPVTTTASGETSATVAAICASPASCPNGRSAGYPESWQLKK